MNWECSSHKSHWMKKKEEVQSKRQQLLMTAIGSAREAHSKKIKQSDDGDYR